MDERSRAEFRGDLLVVEAAGADDGFQGAAGDAVAGGHLGVGEFRAGPGEDLGDLRAGRGPGERSCSSTRSGPNRIGNKGGSGRAAMCPYVKLNIGVRWGRSIFSWAAKQDLIG